VITQVKITILRPVRLIEPERHLKYALSHERYQMQPGTNQFPKLPERECRLTCRARPEDTNAPYVTGRSGCIQRQERRVKAGDCRMSRNIHLSRINVDLRELRGAMEYGKSLRTIQIGQGPALPEYALSLSSRGGGEVGGWAGADPSS
jgi:hypothetical protein